MRRTSLKNNLQRETILCVSNAPRLSTRNDNLTTFVSSKASLNSNRQWNRSQFKKQENWIVLKTALQVAYLNVTQDQANRLGLITKIVTMISQPSSQSNPNQRNLFDNVIELNLISSLYFIYLNLFGWLKLNYNNWLGMVLHLAGSSQKKTPNEKLPREIL